jgi:hemoglobin-like flavoprotein
LAEDNEMTIQESVLRILEKRDDLAALFYEEFFERHPEAKLLFAGVNLEYQTVLLTMALAVIEKHYQSGFPATAMYLKYLGHKHHQRAVPPELYPKWVESMLRALEKFHGQDWDAEVAGQWRAALERATEVMLLGYKEPVHV